MFNASEFGEELQALQSEVSRLMNTSGEGIFDAAKNRSEALADPHKAALGEPG